MGPGPCHQKETASAGRQTREASAFPNGGHIAVYKHMVQLIRSPLNIGRHMPRDRHQNGWVEETGKRLLKWKGHYYVYLIGDNRKEKRHHRALILGLKASMKKWEAERKLRDIIERVTKSDPKSPLPDPSKSFEWFWKFRFLPLKSEWRPSTKQSIVSVMQNQVLPQFGSVGIGDIAKFDLQVHLN